MIQTIKTIYHRGEEKLVLAFSFGRTVSTVTMSVNDLNNLTTRKSSLETICPVVCLVILQDKTNIIKIVGFTGVNKTTIARLDLNIPEKIALLDENPVENFLEDRVAAGEFLGNTNGLMVTTEKKYMFQSYGAVVSPLGGYIAFLHTLVTEGQLRYPLLSNLRFRVTFMIMTEDALEEIAKPVDCTKHSPTLQWWKIQAYANRIKSKDRDTYLEDITSYLLKNVKISDDNTIAKYEHDEQLVNTIVKNVYQPEEFKFYRSYCHYKENPESYPYFLIENLAYTVLSYLINTEDEKFDQENLTEFDCAIILSYIHVLKTSPNPSNALVQKATRDISKKYTFSSTKISIEGEGFAETFNFAPESQSIYTIVSERGHPWRRCGTTLIPILNYEGKSCFGCSRPSIINGNGALSEAILEACDLCIYCGCTFVMNK